MGLDIRKVGEFLYEKVREGRGSEEDKLDFGSFIIMAATFLAHSGDEPLVEGGMTSEELGAVITVIAHRMEYDQVLVSECVSKASALEDGVSRARALFDKYGDL